MATIAKTRHPSARMAEKYPQKAVGEILRTARETQGRSQEELAASVGTTRVTISQYERGSSRPTRYLPALARELSLDADEIRLRGDVAQARDEVARATERLEEALEALEAHRHGAERHTRREGRR